uniref:Uncharacterized protein n=1 Tax=Nomascus leucogenys TaxID=61853 RepID=A0A2I3H532_NOMLE
MQTTIVATYPESSLEPKSKQTNTIDKKIKTKYFGVFSNLKYEDILISLGL